MLQQVYGIEEFTSTAAYLPDGGATSGEVVAQDDGEVVLAVAVYDPIRVVEAGDGADDGRAVR